MSAKFRFSQLLKSKTQKKNNIRASLGRAPGIPRNPQNFETHSKADPALSTGTCKSLFLTRPPIGKYRHCPVYCQMLRGLFRRVLTTSENFNDFVK